MTELTLVEDLNDACDALSDGDWAKVELVQQFFGNLRGGSKTVELACASQGKGGGTGPGNLKAELFTRAMTSILLPRPQLTSGNSVLSTRSGRTAHVSTFKCSCCVSLIPAASPPPRPSRPAKDEADDDVGLPDALEGGRM